MENNLAEKRNWCIKVWKEVKKKKSSTKGQFNFFRKSSLLSNFPPFSKIFSRPNSTEIVKTLESLSEKKLIVDKKFLSPVGVVAHEYNTSSKKVDIDLSQSDLSQQ